MTYLFYGCKSLLLLPDISKWKINNVKNLNYIFGNCKSLSYLPDISKWKTNNVKISNFLFYGCESLVYLPNISKWNINYLNSGINGIINNCISLSYFPGYSKDYEIKEYNINTYECFSLMNTKKNEYSLYDDY